MLLSVDEAVGAVEAELARKGRLNDTVMVLTSDNGMDWGSHRNPNKSSPSASQIPFFVSWPRGVGMQRRTIGERIHNIDLAPTLCELAGCRLGPYPNGQSTPDGKSFLKLLLGEGASMGRDALITDLPAGSGGIPPWYAVTTTKESPLASIGCAAAATGGCRWHYVEYENDARERELYDVSNGPCWTWKVGDRGDPCRLESRHDEPALAVVQEALARRLAELKAEQGATP